MLLWVSIRSLFCNHTHFSPTTQNITLRFTLLVFYLTCFSVILSFACCQVCVLLLAIISVVIVSCLVSCLIVFSLSWLVLQNMPIASLQRAKNPYSNECPGYDTKMHLMVRQQSWSFGEWGVPGVVIPVRVPSMGQIELFNHLLYMRLYANKWLISNWISTG